MVSVRKTSLRLAALQCLKALLSLYVVSLSAGFFGLGIERDAWVVGWSVQLIFFNMLFGPVNEMLRTRFIFLRAEEGEQKALQGVASWMILSFAVAGLVVIAGICFPGILVRFFAPGYTSPAQQLVLADMVRALIPTLLLSELSATCAGLLHVYSIFYIPELFSIAALLINAAMLLLLGRSWGIYVLVIANYINISLLVAASFLFIYKRGIRLSFRRFSWRFCLPFILAALPLYVAHFVGQLGAWSERALSTVLGTGSTSAIDYARKFIDMPLGIMGTVTATVMTPVLAGLWVKEKRSPGYRKELSSYLSSGLLLVSLLFLLLTAGSRDLVRLFLLHGHLTADWLTPIADTLLGFGCGVPGVFIYIVAGQVLITQKQNRLYAGWAIAAQLLAIVLNVLFFRRYDLPVFAWSWSLMQTIAGIFMLYAAHATGKRQPGRWMGLLGFYCLLLTGFWFRTWLPVENPWMALGGLLLYWVLLAYIYIVLFDRLLLMEIRTGWQKIFAHGRSNRGK